MCVVAIQNTGGVALGHLQSVSLLKHFRDTNDDVPLGPLCSPVWQRLCDYLRPTRKKRIKNWLGVGGSNFYFIFLPPSPLAVKGVVETFPPSEHEVSRKRVGRSLVAMLQVVDRAPSAQEV